MVGFAGVVANRRSSSSKTKFNTNFSYVNLFESTSTWFHFIFFSVSSVRQECLQKSQSFALDIKTMAQEVKQLAQTGFLSKAALQSWTEDLKIDLVKNKERYAFVCWVLY